MVARREGDPANEVTVTVSTPRFLELPDGVRRTTLETRRGAFAALEALPGSGVCERLPALLVPGFTGSKEDFLAAMQPLAAAGRRVVAIDMRGQYETRGPDDPAAYTLGSLGADVRAAGVALGRGKHVHMAGHSFGGLAAREAVLAGSPRLASLTLMSSGPAAITGTRAMDVKVLIAALAQIGVQRLWDESLGPQHQADGTPPKIAKFLRTRMLRSSAVGLRVMGEQLLTCPDRVEELADAAPELAMLVVYGEEDETWETAVQEDMAERLDAQRVCIPAAAHSPAVEAPETTASTLTSFWNAAEAPCRPAPEESAGTG
jgi:pimeloyl-ACP methyl ester carboxylesterase